MKYRTSRDSFSGDSKELGRAFLIPLAALANEKGVGLRWLNMREGIGTLKEDNTTDESQSRLVIATEPHPMEITSTLENHIAGVMVMGVDAEKSNKVELLGDGKELGKFGGTTKVSHADLLVII